MRSQAARSLGISLATYTRYWQQGRINVRHYALPSGHVRVDAAEVEAARAALLEVRYPPVRVSTTDTAWAHQIAARMAAGR